MWSTRSTSTAARIRPRPPARSWPRSRRSRPKATTRWSSRLMAATPTSPSSCQRLSPGAICKADGDSIDWQSGDGCGSYKLKDFKPGVSCRWSVTKTTGAMMWPGSTASRCCGDRRSERPHHRACLGRRGRGRPARPQDGGPAGAQPNIQINSVAGHSTTPSRWTPAPTRS